MEIADQHCIELMRKTPFPVAADPKELVNLTFEKVGFLKEWQKPDPDTMVSMYVCSRCGKFKTTASAVRRIGEKALYHNCTHPNGAE